MFCPRCGTKNVDDAIYCAGCGAELPRSGKASAANGFGAPGASPSAPSQMPAAASGASGRARRHGRLPFILAGVVLLAAVVTLATILIVPRLLSSSLSDDEAASIVPLTYGDMARDGGYDYFYSSAENGIFRAKPGVAVEEVVTLKVTEQYGYEMPLEYVSGIAASSGRLYYVLYDMDDDGTTTYELRGCSSDGDDDHLIYSFSSGEDGTYGSLEALNSYDGRAYFALFTYDEDWSFESCKVYSVGPSDDEPVLRCTMEEPDLSQVLILPDRAYYTTSTYGDQVSSGVSCIEYDGGEDESLYETEGVSLYSLTTYDGMLYCMATGSDDGSQRVMSIDPKTGDSATVYRPEEGDSIKLLSISGGYAYLQEYSGAYDSALWDLVRAPLSGEGDATTVCRNLDYYNPSLSVMNGHILVTENGQDVSGIAMRADALSLEDGSVLDRYIS